MNIRRIAAMHVSTSLLTLLPLSAQSGHWTETNPDPAWMPRAGLQVVQRGRELLLMGGRTPIDPAVLPVPGASVIWDDVWSSSDLGRSWQLVSQGDWPARAYFRAVEMRGRVYVLGGQDFNVVQNPGMFPPLIPQSNFFSDVWSSRDGRSWELMTADAGWEGRAGLSALVFRGEIYVFGGSKNDDSAIVGPIGPPRIYFDDVWKSRDGVNWIRLVEHAPWSPRAGAISVVKNGYIYLLGGEDGFACQPVPCTPPYYNDVWRTRDGVNWELVTASAAWSPRPGHQAVVLRNDIYLFGGFGLSQDPSQPFAPSNPMDVWVSRDGAEWRQISNAPWNATSPAEVKYDFAALAARGGRGPMILTFGGDRETFNFLDPTNYLNVDNDVWSYEPPRR